MRAGGIQRPRDFLFSDGDSGLYSRLASAPNAAGTWLANNMAVAYRAVIGFKDANGVVRLSAPNGRLVVVNPADLVMATGAVVLTSNVVTVTWAAGQTQGFRVGDQVTASSTDGSIGGGPVHHRLGHLVDVHVREDGGEPHIERGRSPTRAASRRCSSPSESRPRPSPAWFVQLYRTDEALTAAIDPGDEEFQCYERVILAADVAAGYVTIQDTTPSVFLGAPLPTNANTGQGSALGANERPPLCNDIAVWDGKLWGANVTQRHRMQLRLLGTPDGLGSVAINCRVFTLFHVYTQDLPSQNLQKTVSSLVSFIGSHVPGVTAKSISDGTSPTGDMLVDEIGLASTFVDTALNGNALDAIYAASSTPGNFQEALPLIVSVTSGSRTSNVVSIVATAHGFNVGDRILLASNDNDLVDPNFAGGLKTVASVADANHFTYAESGSNATMNGQLRYVYAATFKSTADTFPVMFSEPGEPEAWPLPNYPGGFPDGAKPLRIKPTPDNGSLLVMLQNGDTYSISGQYPYTTRRVTGSASLVVADSLVEHNDALFGFTTQGIAMVGTAGVGVVGLDVQNQTRQLARGIGDGFPYAEYESFALSYESDRQYQLWTPDPASTSDGHTPDRALVFDSMNQLWTKGFLSLERGWGLVFKGADVAFFGDRNSKPALQGAQGVRDEPLDVFCRRGRHHDGERQPDRFVGGRELERGSERRRRTADRQHVPPRRLGA